MIAADRSGADAPGSTLTAFQGFGRLLALPDRAGQPPRPWRRLARRVRSPEVEPSLAAEVEVRPGGATFVRLDRDRSPAPSWSTLSWLETSIRSYAKFVEVAVKVTATQADEQEFVRRERMAIEEIRGLLAEMLPAGED